MQTSQRGTPRDGGTPRERGTPRDRGQWPGAVLEIRETTGSTMDDARELALSGAPSGSAVMAGFQEAGRGRVPGRTWVSPPWQSLLVTIVLRTPDIPFPLQELPLRAGVAAARAVEEAADIVVQIKWPNDLVVHGRKLAGILCEAHGDVALVGLGVNCLQTAFPGDLAMPAISLLEASGRAVEPRALFPFVLRALAAAAHEAAWRDALDARLYAKGRTVTVDLIGARRTARGVLRGVDPEGRVLLELPDGSTEAIAQGEISPAR